MLRIGELEVQNILDISGLHASIFEVFADATPAALDPHRSWLEPDALCPDSQRIVIPVQTYAVKTPQHRILIDTCVGCDKSNADYQPWHQRRDEGWLQRLADAGVHAEEVDYVMCTHLHSDHCGWNTRLRDGRWVPTFPNARYVFSKAEYEATAKAGGLPYQESVLPIVEAGRADLVELDFALDDHVSLEDTSGHTPGHVAVNLHSQGQRAAMTGDLIHSPIQCVYPHWSPRFDRDPIKAAVTRRRFLEQHADSDTWVLTAHFPPPSYGKVVSNADGFRFRYATAGTGSSS
jgi:glyoxylase-like metal-dependent hydrolase (beta-lactamase superfamily II)